MPQCKSGRPCKSGRRQFGPQSLTEPTSSHAAAAALYRRCTDRQHLTAVLLPLPLRLRDLLTYHSSYLGCFELCQAQKPVDQSFRDTSCGKLHRVRQSQHSVASSYVSPSQPDDVFFDIGQQKTRTSRARQFTSLSPTA